MNAKNGLLGLLLKDFYCIWRYLKIYLLLMLVFVLLPGSLPMLSFLYAVLLPATILAYDENAKWPELAAMLPFSSRTLVLGKYLLGYIFAGVLLALALLSRLVYQLIWPLLLGAPVDNDFALTGEFAFFILLTCLASLVLEALSMPFIFRYGNAKGRLVSFLLFGIIFGASLGIARQFDITALELNISLPVLFLAAAAITLVLNAVSCQISVRMYDKRLRGA